jgi:hypothetical protein
MKLKFIIEISFHFNFEKLKKLKIYKYFKKYTKLKVRFFDLLVITFY